MSEQKRIIGKSIKEKKMKRKKKGKKKAENYKENDGRRLKKKIKV